jgi:hypothetical protein
MPKYVDPFDADCDNVVFDEDDPPTLFDYHLKWLPEVVVQHYEYSRDKKGTISGGNRPPGANEAVQPFDDAKDAAFAWMICEALKEAKW